MGNQEAKPIVIAGVIVGVVALVAILGWLFFIKPDQLVKPAPGTPSRQNAGGGERPVPGGGKSTGVMRGAGTGPGGMNMN